MIIGIIIISIGGTIVIISLGMLIKTFLEILKHE